MKTHYRFLKSSSFDIEYFNLNEIHLTHLFLILSDASKCIIQWREKGQESS